MNKVIIHAHPELEGVISITGPQYNVPGAKKMVGTDRRRRLETDEELLQRVIADDLPKGLDGTPVSHIILDADITGTFPPRGKLFRRAWECADGNKVTVNMPRARDIHMAAIRAARDLEIAKLDVPYLKSLEARDTVEQDRIAALKQALRDIPQTFDLSSARTPDTLKSRWPEALPR